MTNFLARQPILDRSERIFGYELHFREGGNASSIPTPRAEGSNGSAAGPEGLGIYVDDTQAFISFTREALLDGPPPGFPKEKVVLQIPASLEAESNLVAACKRWKEAGYALALENFPTSSDSPLVEFASIIRMDVTASPDRAQWMVIRKLRPSGIIFIADKVDNRTQFQNALQQGYTYFQGQFFLRPQASGGSDVSPTKLVYLLVLGEVTRPEINMDEVARMIKHDLALSYKLLRLLNSARFSFHTQVKSIRHALLLLGENELRKWIGLISVAAMGEGGPPILVTMALVRAAFCESLGSLVEDSKRQADYFFMGLLSSIDILLHRPMRLIMAELPIAADVGGALQGEKGRMRDVLDVVIQYEQGQWHEFSETAKRLNIEEERVAKLYLKALIWSHELPHGQLTKMAAETVPS